MASGSPATVGTMNGRNGMAVKKDGGTKERKLRGFSVSFADNGGAIVRHDRDHGDGPYQPDAQHVFSTPDEMHAHLQTLYPGSKAKAGKPANTMEPGEQA